MKMLVLFLAKCVRNAVKTMVVDRKNKKALALLYLAPKPLRKAGTQAVCRPSSQQNRRGKSELFAWTLSPNFSRLNWTFRPPPKRQLSILLNYFFPLTNFVFDFCCLCLFCYNADQHAIWRQTHGIQHRVISRVWSVLVNLWCGQTDVRPDVRTDSHVTITSLPKFVWLDRLPNFLSNGAPLTR